MTKDGIDVQDYYGLLELPEPNTATSTSDEIRKAYRRLALRFHPDKNPDDVEAANERFRLIQAAYEVLSDDQERAWYDAHREQILGGGMDDDDDYIDEAFDEQTSAPGLTPRQIMRFLDASLCMDVQPPGADEAGFFGTYRRVFERLAEEEKGAAPYPGETSSQFEPFPSFGYSHTPYLHSKHSDGEATIHQTQIRDFYAVWSGFSTRKGFAWRDGYRVNDAPDRRVKRAMEKENKRMRETARREYNDTVRSLVSFIRKRDPRVKAHINAQSSATNSAEEMQRRKEAAEREMRELEERARAYQKQSWDRWEHGAEDSEEDSEASFGEEVPGNDEDKADDDDFDEGADGLECFACDKVFQSEAAFANHERSNKHKKQVQKLRRDMQREDRDLQKSMKEMNVEEEEDENIVMIPAQNEETQDEMAGLSKKARQKLKKRMKEQEKAAASETATPEVGSEEEEEVQNADQQQEPKAEEQTEAPPSNGKKTRRAKKDAKFAKERCNVCSTGFDSRSKLFTHIRETGHALAPSTKPSKK
ncbi:DnaJ-domain-containing protein [Meira miltonrushii]|uniref:DnaJ-domain-containing protein n=1 Tax=Meira miltonrushii TaxID=1280837 RepID=A0A316VGE3_9BASI|nr:DnaJ-domain-containing protein [Meira miltonrushii]PWN35393.1 DnaJ-domain-containing protein [Meira miltonrushii]